MLIRGHEPNDLAPTLLAFIKRAPLRFKVRLRDRAGISARGSEERAHRFLSSRVAIMSIGNAATAPLNASPLTSQGPKAGLHQRCG
jgi:hypothetical protein